MRYVIEVNPFCYNPNPRGVMPSLHPSDGIHPPTKEQNETSRLPEPFSTYMVMWSTKEQNETNELPEPVRMNPTLLT